MAVIRPKLANPPTTKLRIEYEFELFSGIDEITLKADIDAAVGIRGAAADEQYELIDIAYAATLVPKQGVVPQYVLFTAFATFIKYLQ